MLRISVIWACGIVGDNAQALLKFNPAEQSLLLMLLLWKDPNQDILGNLWKRTQIWDILGPTSGKEPKLGHSVSFLWKDPNQDILGPTSRMRDPCQNNLDPSPQKRHKQGYFASFLWKRTHDRIFWVPPLEKDPNWNILGPSSEKTQHRIF